jgi:hypothetical protein
MITAKTAVPGKTYALHCGNDSGRAELIEVFGGDRARIICRAVTTFCGTPCACVTHLGTLSEINNINTLGNFPKK